MFWFYLFAKFFISFSGPVPNGAILSTGTISSLPFKGGSLICGMQELPALQSARLIAKVDN
jgi:hypothetical protein